MKLSDQVRPTHDVRLPSGLRVLVLDRPGSRVAVVLSQLLGGSRVDPDGAAGMAHLTEHLLAQGRRPDGERWVAPLLAHGAHVHATTHPDLLEFVAEVPHTALFDALRAERARFNGWPALRTGVFERQRNGVCREITDHLSRPTRSLPWPALGVRTFGSWAEGHDAFGQVEHVRALSEDDCREFSLRQHRPETSVVVVVADLTHVEGGVPRILDTLVTPPAAPARPARGPIPSPAQAAGIEYATDWTATYSVGALAWRVPSVVDQPQLYAGFLAIAAHLTNVAPGRARLGQMTAMDRRDSDALTFTAVNQRSAAPALSASIQEIEALAQDGGHGPRSQEVERAIDQARADLAQRLDRPAGQAQLLGRGLLLGHDPAAAISWVDAVADLRPAQVAHAAAQLASIEPVGVVGSHTRTIDATPPTVRVPAPPALVQTGQHGLARPRRILAIDRPSLTNALALRLSPATDQVVIRRLRSEGFRLTADDAGWVLAHASTAPADTVAAAALRAVGEDAQVDDMVVVGQRAHATRALRNGEPAGQIEAASELAPQICVVPAAGDISSLASATFVWALPEGGFVPRWLGVALLLGIHQRDDDGDMSPFNAPAGSTIVARQQYSGSARQLTIDVFADVSAMPRVLAHLQHELRPDNLRLRATSTARAAAALAEGWRRDWHDSAVLAQRALTMIELGASDEEVVNFDVKLRTTQPEDVVRTLLHDLGAPPRGVLRTPQPGALTLSDLPTVWQPSFAQ